MCDIQSTWGRFWSKAVRPVETIFFSFEKYDMRNAMSIVSYKLACGSILTHEAGCLTYDCNQSILTAADFVFCVIAFVLYPCINPLMP